MKLLDKSRPMVSPETIRLILVTIFWGMGFPIMKIVSDEFTTFSQIGWRFLIATVVLAIVFYKRRSLLNRAAVKSGLLLSLFLFATYVLATRGIENTSSSRASFFCCLAVVIVPIYKLLLFGIRLARRNIVSILICVAGIFILSFSRETVLDINRGDFLCLMCSCCSAGHIVATEKTVKNNDPAMVTLIQMAFISMFAFVLSFVSAGGVIPDVVSAKTIPALLFMGVFGTGVAFYWQTQCQKSVSAVKVGIIFSLEPVNGAIASWLVLGDIIGAKHILGGLLIFISLVYSETEDGKY